jgi:hypothetical protein
MCLNLVHSAISYSLQCTREDCVVLNLISGLYKASFHLNLYVYIFYFNYQFGGLLHVVCVLKCCKDAHFLVLFCSRSMTFVFDTFAVKWQTCACQHHYVCLSACYQFRTAKGISLEFYIRNFLKICHLLHSVIHIRQK